MDSEQLGPRLVCFTPHLPYEGVPHAGGEYVKRHLEALVATHRVTVVAPANRDNLAHASSVAPPSVDVLIPRATPTPWLRLAGTLVKPVKALRGASMALSDEVTYRRSSELRTALQNASIVEFQWTESASLLRFSRKAAPNASTVLVIHDVLAQRWWRAFKKANSLRSRIYNLARTVSALRAERVAFEAVDRVVAFSQKDADLVARIAPNANVLVLYPPLGEALPLEPEHGSGIAHRTRDEVLFTGALSRPENEEALLWFIGNVWPLIVSVIPSARFIIAGAHPPDPVCRAAAGQSILVTGFVPDLTPLYRTCGVFVVPLQRGAGVKFKTVSAMLAGAPIVSTSVGVEGIGTSALYIAVAETAADFASAVIRAIRNPDWADAIALSAQSWAQTQYDPRRFEQNLLASYAHFAGAADPSGRQ